MRKLGLLLLVAVTAAFVWSQRASLHYFYGCHLLENGRYERAVSSFSRTLEVSPEYKPALDGRGRAYWRLGDTGKAEENFTAAMDLDPGYALAYCHLGTMMLETETGDQKKAVYYVQKAIDFEPTYTTPYLILAQYFAQAGDWPRAEKLLEEAVSVSREKGRALYIRGRLLLKRGDPEGMRDLESACSEFSFRPACETDAQPAETSPSTVSGSVRESG